MSNKFYPKQAKFETKSQVCPNSLVFHRQMSDAAKILILALNGIASNAPGWTPVQCDIGKRLGWGREKMQNAIKDAVKCGYLLVRQSRDKINSEDFKKGRFAYNEFEFDIDGGYVTSPSPLIIVDTPQEAPAPKTANPSTAQPSTANPPLPMPNDPVPPLDLSKGNAPLPPQAPIKALPSSTEEAGNGQPIIVPSATRKFKRPEPHQSNFTWLMGLGLTDDQNRVSEDEMSFLSFKHSRKKLEDAYCHLQYKIAHQNFKPSSMIAVFKHLLKNEHCPVDANTIENAKNAASYAKEVEWHSLLIKPRYVHDKDFSGKDISLNMEPMAFFELLVHLHQLVKG